MGFGWFTIVGNALGGNIQLAAIKFPPFATNRLGVNTRISNNPGFNPVDTGLYPPPAVPATSGTALANPYFADAMVVITVPTGVTNFKVTLTSPIDSTVTDYFGLGTTFSGPVQLQVLVPCGYSIALTFTGTPAPTWSWFPT
jgi:hypothetical protein